MRFFKFVVASFALVLTCACSKGGGSPTAPGPVSPPGPTVRASIDEVASVYQGDPSCTLGCAPAIPIPFDATTSCYVMADSSVRTVSLKVNTTNPKVAGRMLRLSWENDFKYNNGTPDEFSEPMRGTNVIRNGGFGIPTKKGVYTARLDLLETGSDLAGVNTELTKSYSFCVN